MFFPASRQRNPSLRFAPKYLFFVLVAVPVLTVAGPFSRRLRAAIHQVGVALGINKPPPLEIPLRPLSVLFGSGSWSVALPEPDGVDGNVSAWELIVLNRSAAQRAARRFFEIGTFDGRTILNLMANAPEEARAFTLDLPASGLEEARLALVEGEKLYINKAVSGGRFQGTPQGARITQLLGDSATFDFSPYAGTIDFVFVDGSHAYDYVRQDTETAVSLIGAAGGLVAWHDYGTWEEVTQALNELHRADSRFAGLFRVEGTSLVFLEVPPRAEAA